jgi:hypothetical protein
MMLPLAYGLDLHHWFGYLLQFAYNAAWEGDLA